MKSDSALELTKTLMIINDLGIHARSAAKIARLAEQAHGDVFIIKEDMSANAANILETISLFCPKGTEITIRITDPQDLPVLEQITQLIKAGFGE